jgi:hypothetical protein
MSDTSNPTLTPPPQTPLPNDAAARSPTGEILEPSQIKPQTPTPQTPAKPDGDPAQTSTSTDPKPEAKADAPKAPDTYADFTAPEGYTLDKAAIDAAVPIFKELGLNQEQAQRLVEFHSKQMIDAAKAPEATYTDMRNDWQAKAKADPDMAKAVNGDKTGLDAVKLDMGRALSALGDPALATEFKAAMDLTGAGDHPAFIKTFWKLAQFVTEGKHVTGQNPSPHGQRPPGTNERPSAAASLYPNLPH